MNPEDTIPKVRRFLNDLDGSQTATHDQSVNAIAKEYGIDRDSIMEFRSGSDTALDTSTVNIWAQLIGADSSPYMSDYPDANAKGFYDQTYGQNADRDAKFDQYDVMQSTRGEVDSAASVWADMVCTGAITEENRYSGGFLARMVTSKNKKDVAVLSEISRYVNDYILPSTVLHQIVRDTCVYGTHYEQLGYGKRNGEMHVVKTIGMPIRNTRVVDPENAEKTYGYFKNNGDSEPEKWFPSHQMAMFANRKSRSDVEGQSVFKSSLRSWVQVEAMEGGMITRRLERAPQRYRWIVDTAGMKDADSRFNEVERWKRLYKKTRTVNTNRNFQQLSISPPTGDDLWIGKSNKDSPADVSAVEGDANLGEIADFSHFFNRMLSGLGPPKHHLGYEADTMRSVGTDLTIVFARKARRVQMQVARTINFFYWIELLLRGIDPRDMDYIIVPPTLGTRDELVRAQVMMTHATVVKYLSDAFTNTGEVPSPQWFLRYVMGMDDDSIEALDMKKVIGGGKNASVPPANKMTPGESANMREKLMKNDEIAAELKWTGYILSERMIAKAPPELLIERGIVNRGDFVPELHIDHFVKEMKLDVSRALNLAVPQTHVDSKSRRRK